MLSIYGYDNGYMTSDYLSLYKESLKLNFIRDSAILELDLVEVKNYNKKVLDDFILKKDE